MRKEAAIQAVFSAIFILVPLQTVLLVPLRTWGISGVLADRYLI